MTESTGRDVLAEPRTEAGRGLWDWVRTTSRIEEKYRTEYIAAFRKDIIAIETEAAGEAGLRAALAEFLRPQDWLPVKGSPGYFRPVLLFSAEHLERLLALAAPALPEPGERP